jgi:hypothetical protein
LRTRADAEKQALNPAEEEVLIDRCAKMQDWGFPLRVYKVVLLATGILQKRVPKAELGKGWKQGFYKRHGEVKSRYSKAIDYVRACKGNNLAIVKEFFKFVRSIPRLHQ